MNNSKGEKKRGSDAVQNQFIFESLRFVLGEIKPGVFVGENHHMLYTASGSKLLGAMVEVG